MSGTSETLSEIDVLRAALAAAEARVWAAEDELAQAHAAVSASDAMIRYLRLQIAKFRRELCGHGAERQIQLIEQLEIQLEDLETELGQDQAKTDAAVAKTTAAAFERRRPVRKPFPEHHPQPSA